MNATEMQYRAFLAVVIAATLIALSPIIVAGIRGESLPAGLIDIADKSVVAFAGLLGAIGALLFRQSGADERRVDNTTKALDAVQSAISATPAGKVQAEIVNAHDNPVPTVEENRP